MTTATDGAGILDAILAAPGDDLPRLAYADWLDENGQAGFAAFIRYQMERPDEAVAGGPHSPLRFSSRDGSRHFIGPFRWALWFAVRRGFVEKIVCPLAAWESHGPAVVAAHPVTRAELTDRQAWADGPEESSVYWWSLGVGQARSDCRWVLPVPVFDLLPGVAFYRDGGSCKEYGGEGSVRANAAALDALSAALIAWAKPDLCRECGGSALRLAEYLGYTHFACRRCGAICAGG